jgi:thiamine-monophosphate kinase
LNSFHHNARPPPHKKPGPAGICYNLAVKVSELGEFGLIDLLAGMIASSGNNQLPPCQKLIIGIGDDAAAWHGEAAIQLATVDSLVQDVHFSLSTATWKELGWKSLAVNLSDIAAMGGIPAYALVALALPGSTEVADVTALYEGMLELAMPSEVVIVGGNISQAPQVSITITVLGSSQSKNILRRAAARPGDAIAVTGHLGSAAAGLEMLKQKLRFAPEVTTHLREAFLRPRPRIVEGQMLLRLGVATAIDISDGLLSDLRQVCQASRVSARIYIDRIPIPSAVRDNFGDRALGLALGGGEDYELLFTAGAGLIGRVQKEAVCPVTTIGEIAEGRPGEISLLDAKGNPCSPPGTGWEHFRAA